MPVLATTLSAMIPSTRLRTAAVSAALICFAPSLASAQTAQTAPIESAAQTAAEKVAASEALALPLGELAAVASGASILTMSNQTVSGSVSDVTVAAGSVETGGISLDNALSNFSGIGSFVFNTGNASTLQSVVSVTIGPAAP